MSIIQKAFGVYKKKIHTCINSANVSGTFQIHLAAARISSKDTDLLIVHDSFIIQPTEMKGAFSHLLQIMNWLWTDESNKPEIRSYSYYKTRLKLEFWQWNKTAPGVIVCIYLFVWVISLACSLFWLFYSFLLLSRSITISMWWMYLCHCHDKNA